MSMSVAGYILFAMVVGGMTLARVVMNTALTNVQTSAQQAAQALAQAQAQAEQLAQANATQESQLNEQSRLLGLVATLEMPVVQLADGILFAPIVGHIDSRRAQIITERLLAVAYDRRARHMIMDVAGVSLIDTSVASALVQTAQALRLLGCSVTISGVSSSVALTLTQLGVSLEGITTVRSPQEALTQSASIASTPAIEQAWQ
jgi:anti-anti-sigma regulatory factor